MFSQQSSKIYEDALGDLFRYRVLKILFFLISNLNNDDLVMFSRSFFRREQTTRNKNEVKTRKIGDSNGRKRILESFFKKH